MLRSHFFVVETSFCKRFNRLITDHNCNVEILGI